MSVDYWRDRKDPEQSAGYRATFLTDEADTLIRLPLIPSISPRTTREKGARIHSYVWPDISNTSSFLDENILISQGEAPAELSQLFSSAGASPSR